MIESIVEFLKSVASDVSAEGVLIASLFVADRVRPSARRCLSAWWRRHGPRIAAGFASVWRKALVALTVVYGVGGVLAYGLTGGIDDSAPLWAICWLGSLSLSLWGCAAWQGCRAVRWAARRAWGMLT